MNLLLILTLFSQTPAVSSNFSNNLDVWNWTKNQPPNRFERDPFIGSFYNDTAFIENTLSLSAQFRYFNGFLEALYLNNEIHLKKRISFETPNISFLFGDFYQTYGNGLMLGMTALEFKGFERRINGIMASTKIGCVTLSEIYGTPSIIDRANRKYDIYNIIGDTDTVFIVDPTDKIAGINVSVPIFTTQTVFNVRGLEIKRDSGGLKTPIYTTVIGGEVKLNTNWCEFNIEGMRKTKSDTLDTLGFGSYLSTKIYFGSYIFGMQGLSYERLNTYEYACLPTLNKNEYSINNGKNELGYKFSLQKAFDEIVFNSYFSNTFTREDTNGNKNKLLETYADMEFKDITASFRITDLDSGIYPNYKNKQQIESNFSGEIEMFKAELSFSKVNGISLLDSAVDFYDIGFGLNFFINEQVTLYSTCTMRSKEELTESPGKLWAGMGLKLNFRDKVLGEICYGNNEKGGLLCSGGVCRWVDPYNGLKAKLTLTF